MKLQHRIHRTPHVFHVFFQISLNVSKPILAVLDRPSLQSPSTYAEGLYIEKESFRSLAFFLLFFPHLKYVYFVFYFCTYFFSHLSLKGSPISRLPFRSIIS